MTNPKTETKTETKTDTTKAKQVPKDLQTAYEIHTLAQMIYGQLVSIHPWVATFSASNPFSEPTGWPPTSPVRGPSGAWGDPGSRIY